MDLLRTVAGFWISEDVYKKYFEIRKRSIRFQTVDMVDGRTIIAPLSWYPRLWYGKPEERANFDIIGDGAIIHWPDLDEDLSVSGILAGRRSGESQQSLKKWLEKRTAQGK